jgi:hypothetical protein
MIWIGISTAGAISIGAAVWLLGGLCVALLFGRAVKRNRRR